MEQKIIIKNREFIYNPQKLTYENSHIINVDTAKADLFLFNQIAKTNDFKFILFFGTMLGAVREHGFIKHDTDIDVVAADEDKLLDIIPELQKEGFSFIRYYTSKLKTMYSFSKEGVYIDVYMAKQAGKEHYYLCGSKIPATFIEELEPISFLGETFLIPREYEKVLVLLYGKDWQIPQENKNGDFPVIFHRDFLQLLIRKTPRGLRNLIKKLLGINK